MDSNPFNEPCPVYGAMIEIGLCSDTMDVADDAVREELIELDLIEHGFGARLTGEQVKACKNCPRRKMT